MSNTKPARKNVYSVKNVDIVKFVEHFSHKNINYEIKFNIEDYQKSGKSYVVVDSPKRWVTLSKRPIGDFMTVEEYKMFIPRLLKNVYSLDNNAENMSELAKFGYIPSDVDFSSDHEFICFNVSSKVITSAINQVGTYNVFAEELDLIIKS